MDKPGTHVIKLGGSLLGWNELSERFQQWLEANGASRNLIVVGGGDLVNAFRQQMIGQTHDRIAAHWHCIELMSINANVVASMLGLPIVDRFSNADNPEKLHSAVFDVNRWMRQCNPGPCSWDVSSDSIAAFVAAEVDADDLTLLKSNLSALSACTSLADLPAGYVDEHFLTAVKLYEQSAPDQERNIRFVNLRDDHFAEICFPMTT